MSYFSFITTLFLLVFYSSFSYADDNALSEQSIKEFYKDLVESKISGGEYLISFHDKHYSDDMKMILNIKRKIGGNDMPRVFQDHDKKTFMEAVSENADIIDHKEGRANIISILISDDGNSAQAHVMLFSKFIVQVDRLAPKKTGIEAMDCKDRIILSDAGIVQIIASQCDVNVSMDE